MKNRRDPRHIARQLALQMLFMNDFVQDNEKQKIPFTFQELIDIDSIQNIKVNKNLVNALAQKAMSFKEEINQIIKKLAPERPIQDIAKVDLQILYLTISEGFITQTNPKKVIIDEGIELAREFGGQKSPQFINGVLGNLLKNKKLVMKLSKLCSEKKQTN